jgi:DNA-binding winged helix-turn-helix (wHTH) protein
MHERSSEIVRFGPFRYVPRDGLRRAEAEVPLPPRALAILEALLARPGEVVSKAELLDAGWKDAFVTEASLLEAVRVLRTALGDDRRSPAYIQTVHRRGYRFLAPVSRDERRQDAGLTSPASVSLSADSAVEPPFFSGPEWHPILRACTGALAATAVTTLLVAVLGPRPDPVPAGRFSIALPDAVQVDSLDGTVAASADGLRFAFVALDQGRARLFVRDVDRHLAVPLNETDGASQPFFSPDGTQMGFFADGLLKTVAVEGGTPQEVARVVAPAGAAWMSDGEIVFGGGPGGGLARVPEAGGSVTPLIAPEAGSPHVRFGWPEPVPGRRGLIFTIVTPEGSEIALLEPGETRYRVLARDVAFGRVLPTGHLVAQRDGELVAAPYAFDDGRVTGGWRSAVTEVATAGVLVGPRFAVSRSGSLVYVPGRASGPSGLRWSGSLQGPRPDDLIEALVLDPETPMDARVDRVASGLGPPRPGERAVSPTWRPDGLEVAFALNKFGPFNMFVKPGDGGVPHALGQSPWNQTPTSWSPDGRRLIFTEFHPTTGADIWQLDLLTRTRRPLVRTPFDETGARYSPDGRWIAYLTNQSGRWEAVIAAADGVRPHARIAASRLIPGGLGPAAHGRELRVVLAWLRDVTRLVRGPA